MTTGLFIFAVGLLPHIQSVLVLAFSFIFVTSVLQVYTSVEETVWLKDVTTNFQTEKRTLSNHDLPDDLTFLLKRGTDELTLNLRRNYDINPNANVYLERTLKDGQTVLVKARDLEKEDLAYYQDKDNGAFVTVRCAKQSNEQCDRVITGNIRIGEYNYDLQLADADVNSGNLLEFPGEIAKRYVLLDQAQVQRRKNLVENTDTEHVSEKRFKEDLMAILRRIKGHHKQDQVSPSDDMSSRNVEGLHNRGVTDTSRQLTDVYHVKVAVLIEIGFWDLYKELLESKSLLTTRSVVKKKIIEAFSHVMNGVNLRYKDIDDPSISINVILSDFIFLQNAFKATSDVTIINGTSYLDAKSYYSDLAKWDESIGRNHMTVFDHAMLFTRFKLKDDGQGDLDVGGISLNSGVCDVGERLSIVEAGDFVWMTWAAAHELGHNLGSWHDGEEDSAACKADDYFIMTPHVPKPDPSTPYTRNQYIFSNCSVESFKKTLKGKDCVTKPGKFYKEAAYKKIVKVQPGEVYTPNDQCLLIMGAKSALCETDVANICRLMRCTDPITGKCRKEYYGAASGTSCGLNEWCFEERCVKAPRG